MRQIWYACAPRPDYAVCDFHLVHDTRIKLYAWTRISVGLKSGMNLFICLSQERVLSGYHLNGYRKVYGDDMRTRSSLFGNMWTLRLWDISGLSKWLIHLPMIRKCFDIIIIVNGCYWRERFLLFHSCDWRYLIFFSLSLRNALKAGYIF